MPCFLLSGLSCRLLTAASSRVWGARHRPRRAGMAGSGGTARAQPAGILAASHVPRPPCLVSAAVAALPHCPTIPAATGYCHPAPLSPWHCVCHQGLLALLCPRSQPPLSPLLSPPGIGTFSTLRRSLLLDMGFAL